jgi:hypothetical protein
MIEDYLACNLYVFFWTIIHTIWYHPLPCKNVAVDQAVGMTANHCQRYNILPTPLKPTTSSVTITLNNWDMISGKVRGMFEGLFPWVRVRSVNRTVQIHPLPRLRTRGALTIFPRTSSWRSAQEQGYIWTYTFLIFLSRHPNLMYLQICIQRSVCRRLAGKLYPFRTMRYAQIAKVYKPIAQTPLAHRTVLPVRITASVLLKPKGPYNYIL